MGTLGRTTRNGKKAVPRRVERLEHPHPAIAKLAVALREHKEALEQQAATAQILRALARSSSDAQPVFQAIVDNAHRLCGAAYSVLYRYDGEMVDVIASKHMNAKAQHVLRALHPQPPRRDKLVGRAVLEGKIFHTADISNDARFPASTKALPRRAVVSVPLVRDGAVLGAISCGRVEAKPFSKKEIRLLQTFADQAVIAIENVRLFNETKEALEHQKASADILRIVAGSVENTDPVFEAITAAGMRLVPGARVSLVLAKQGQLHYVSHSGVPERIRAYVAKFFPLPLKERRTVSSIAILEKRILHIPDIEAAFKSLRSVEEMARASAYRAILCVPLLREGQAIGAISVTRDQPGAFSEKQVELAKTFADQAVIAIRNAQFFRDIQDRNAELKQALDFQGASGEILSSISSSIADTKPVFDAIVRNVVRLFGTQYAAVFMLRGEQLELAALKGDPRFAGEFTAMFPQPVDHRTLTGKVLATGKVIQLAPIIGNPESSEQAVELARRFGYNAMIVAPMIREDKVIGAIGTARVEAIGFDDKQVALLKAFADQAVIAIENVRLFNETKEALERQTATADILKVISSSPTDIQPVLDAVAETAARVCGANDALIRRVDGDRATVVAHVGAIPVTAEARSVPVTRGTAHGRAILERRTIHVEDIVTEFERGEYPDTFPYHQGSAYRTLLVAPLLREGAAIGAIVIRRVEMRPFSEKQLRLLETFADQAVIAIENVRLFKELEARNRDLSESLDQQTSTAEVLKTISRSTFDLDAVLQTLLDNATRLSGAERAVMLRPDTDGNYVPVLTFNYEADSPLIARMRERPIRPGRDSINGRVLLEKRPIHVPDVLADPEYGRQDLAEIGSFRTVLSVPMLRDGEAIGLIALIKGDKVDPFTEKQMEVVTTFADQAVIAIENVRLFKEIEEKSAQLEVANKHKSDFLANMSHELRTPLNAIIGFSEALMEKMFGELNEKQADYLRDIHESGKHLLSLINDILDLSKIEAGRMELELSSFHLPSALSNAMTLIRERAQRHAIELGLEVDERLGEFKADERKFKQIMLNLLSNAVKFTPDGGRVDVSAKKNTDKIEIAVKDTGIGIAPEDQAAVFEEFKQVGRDQMRKAEGTGLGLALTRRFVELHGGEIRLESTPGRGSSFIVVLPVRT